VCRLQCGCDMNSVERVISLSSGCFVNVVWPVIKTSLGGGRVYPVEGNALNEMQMTLDRVSGIDAWHVMENDEGVRGIASRIQPDDGRHRWPYNSFTIRKSIVSGSDTEYQKRMKAITQPERGYLFPPVTVQAYVRTYDGPVVSVAIMTTSDLYKSVKDHKWPVVPGADGNKFLAVWWEAIKDLGYKIKVIEVVNDK